MADAGGRLELVVPGRSLKFRFVSMTKGLCEEYQTDWHFCRQSSLCYAPAFQELTLVSQTQQEAIQDS